MNSGNSAKVYVVVTAKWQGGDVGGFLMHSDGSVSASHMSSTLGWLEKDLTTNFSDRREALEARYPDGYEVVVVESKDNIPEEIAEFLEVKS